LHRSTHCYDHHHGVRVFVALVLATHCGNFNMGLLDPFLPALTWQLELYLALLSTFLLVVQLSQSRHPIPFLKFLPYVTIPVSSILLISSYISLSHLEQLYTTGTASSTMIDGISLQARRMKEQRDVYLAMWSVVVGAVLLRTSGLMADLGKWKAEYWKLRRRLDEFEGKKE